MKCSYCSQEIVGIPFEASPSRHFMSPSKADFKLLYCNKEHATLKNDSDYAFIAELDRNASDSECFEGDGWEGIYRTGTCKISGRRIRVEPLMPGERSGQPTECVEHFKLRRKYQAVIDKEINKSIKKEKRNNKK